MLLLLFVCVKCVCLCKIYCYLAFLLEQLKMFIGFVYTPIILILQHFKVFILLNIVKIYKLHINYVYTNPIKLQIISIEMY